MKLIEYQKFLGALAVTTLFIMIIWLTTMQSPNSAFNTPVIIPSIPFHSNSRLLPFEYWHHRNLYPEMYSDASCTRFPSVSDINYAANSWQLLQVINGNVYLYGAYWDDRFEESLVRVVIYSDVLPLPKLYCQLWFPGDNEPQIELAEVLYAWEPVWGGSKAGVNEPYILGCRSRRHVPDPDIAPAAVSVVTALCEAAHNVLNIQGSPFLKISKNSLKSRQELSVAVCVKWLHFRTDVSINIVEWLQLLKHFGAEKVFVYAIKLHPNTKRTLQYYEESGFVVVTEASHPPQISGVHYSRSAETFHDYRRELVSLNDCLYRNLRQYDWITALDMDELIVPVRDNSWLKLIKKEITVSKVAALDALVFRNYYVLDGAQKDLLAPKEARILGHTWRSRTPSPPGNYVKSFFNTSSVTAMHNHTPLRCWRNCNKRSVNVDAARLMHFRETCAEGRTTCTALTDVVRDDVLKRWRQQILKEIYDIMKKVHRNNVQLWTNM